MHHILAEIIQGGIVLETNGEEISNAGSFKHALIRSCCMLSSSPTVAEASKARKQSFASANPLAIGVGGVGGRGAAIPTPLGWLTGKLLPGVGTR